MIQLAVNHQPFRFVGTASNFKLKKKNRIRRFDLITDQGKYRFKIPSKLHKRMHFELHPQTKLEVSGIIWTHPKKNKMKLEIQQITPLSPTVAGDRPQAQLMEGTVESTTQKVRQPEVQWFNAPAQFNGQSLQKKKHRILICKKSACWKQGGQLAYERLQKAIQDKGLEDQVCIKTTGCMDRCKKAPNLVVMPDKKKYTNFAPNSAEMLVEYHFGDLYAAPESCESADGSLTPSCVISEIM